jgi:putative phosphoesterase
MTRIGIISDTHGYLDQNVFAHFTLCDEIWHAGDFGNIELANELAGQSGKLVRGVFGNIDGKDIRSLYPEQLVFTCEQVKVMIRHIGGSPPKYNPETRKELELHHPQLFVSGHSHILKIIYDERIQCLHINPGAAGNQGWHKVRTIVTLAIDGKEMKDCRVIELGKRGIGQ